MSSELCAEVSAIPGMFCIAGLGDDGGIEGKIQPKPLRRSSLDWLDPLSAHCD